MLATDIAVFIPETISEKRGVLLSRFYRNQFAIPKPDLIEHFPGQIAALHLRDPRMVP